MSKAEFRTEGTYAPDKLIAGNAHLLVGRKVTIISGQNLTRGAVLGKILILALIILFIQKRPQGLFALKGRVID